MTSALVDKIMNSTSTEYDHLFIDGDGNVRDRLIEGMFEDCFHGRELTERFKTNFKMYCEMLIGPVPVPDEIYSDRHVAVGWLTTTFGICHLRRADRYDIESDDDLAHCNYEVRLRSRFAKDNEEVAFAPTEIHAVLLSVIIVLRAVAQRWFEIRYKEEEQNE